MSTFFFYTLSYILISGCIICPPTEFISAGLTVEGIFSDLLGNENLHFIQYHLRRSVITLFVHSMLPFGYICGLILFDHVNFINIAQGYQNLWLIFSICTVLLPLYALYKILTWFRNNWSKHPIVQNLVTYCNNNNIDNNTTTWSTIATDINIECQRMQKFIIDANSVSYVIATHNWIIKVMPYTIVVAHQSDTALIVNKSDTHNMSPATRGEIQFINIQVKPTRTGAKPFDIRINALDFQELQDRISRPIAILQNIKFYKTLLDRFIDNFKEQVQENPVYLFTDEVGQCIGCMQAASNVKLSKQCSTDIGSGHSEDCVTCYCPPTWCIDCMAKWFASKQNEYAPETWLSSKCTCPLCRAKFCILDVCLVLNI